jgi:hypothetical protein
MTQEPQQQCYAMMNLFSGANPGWTASMQLHMQELANVFNAMFPPGSLVRTRQYGLVPRPMDDAETIADAAAVIGGFAGIAASLVIGSALFPVIAGATVGMFVVGMATYAYACANPNLKANDFDQAVADSAWQGTQLGAAADVVTMLRLAKLPEGLSPYGFLAGGLLGAVKFLFHKYYPYAFPTNGHANGGGPSNPSIIGWRIGYPVYTVWGVTVTFTGTPCTKIGCK